MSPDAQASYTEAVLDPERGYFLVRGFSPEEEVNRYREECESFLRTGPRVARRPGYGRGAVNRDNMFDYVYLRGVRSNIYQFPHNPQSPAGQRLYAASVALRDLIEEQWMGDPDYRRVRATQREYIQVTHMADGGTLKRHCDFRQPSPFPKLQCTILLSEPGTDFQEGDLIFHTRAGGAVSCHRDLGMRKGDAVLFDRSMDHELTLVRADRDASLGRWSAVIGAGYKRPDAVRRVARRLAERIRALGQAVG